MRGGDFRVPIFVAGEIRISKEEENFKLLVSVVIHLKVEKKLEKNSSLDVLYLLGMYIHDCNTCTCM